MHEGSSPDKRRTWLIPVIAASLLVAALAGGLAAYLIYNDGSAPLASGASPAASTTATVSDPNGHKACQLVKAAREKDSLRDMAVVAEISTAAKTSTDFGIAFQGQMINDRRELAQASKPGPERLENELELLTALANLETRCIKAGLS